MTTGRSGRVTLTPKCPSGNHGGSVLAIFKASGEIVVSNPPVYVCGCKP